MKKLLLTLLISIISITSASADWKIDNEYIFDGTLIITQCSENPTLVGDTPDFWLIPSKFSMSMNCGNNNKITVLTDGTAKSGMTESGEITTSKIGQIIVFFLGFTLLIAVVGLIYKAINKSKSKGNASRMMSKSIKKRTGKILIKDKYMTKARKKSGKYYSQKGLN